MEELFFQLPLVDILVKQGQVAIEAKSLVDNYRAKQINVQSDKQTYRLKDGQAEKLK